MKVTLLSGVFFGLASFLEFVPCIIATEPSSLATNPVSASANDNDPSEMSTSFSFLVDETFEDSPELRADLEYALLLAANQEQEYSGMPFEFYSMVIQNIYTDLTTEDSNDLPLSLEREEESENEEETTNDISPTLHLGRCKGWFLRLRKRCRKNARLFDYSKVQKVADLNKEYSIILEATFQVHQNELSQDDGQHPLTLGPSFFRKWRQRFCKILYLIHRGKPPVRCLLDSDEPDDDY